MHHTTYITYTHTKLMRCIAIFRFVLSFVPLKPPKNMIVSAQVCCCFAMSPLLGYSYVYGRLCFSVAFPVTNQHKGARAHTTPGGEFLTQNDRF